MPMLDAARLSKTRVEPFRMRRDDPWATHGPLWSGGVRLLYALSRRGLAPAL